MRYALANGEIREAERNLSGECRGCGQPMLARCGPVRVNHWSHKGKLICDPWVKRDKTEWHINWQDCFPKPWQEFRFTAENGEWHIADVKTDQGWVLEFQHSPIKSEERLSRNAFYKKLVWVVNGLRLKRDHSQFMDSLKEVASINSSPIIRRIFSVRANEGALLRDWASSSAPVFFDFGEEHVLWCLLPSGPDQIVYVIEFSRTYFLKFHIVDSSKVDHFAEFLNNLIGQTTEITKRLQIPKGPVRRPDIWQISKVVNRSVRRRRHFRF